jgi:hypothetical protein
MKQLSFKSKARNHQIDFRGKHINPRQGQYATYLTNKDAEAGKNFYGGFPKLLGAVNTRYPFANRKTMYKDMLRSEHIPFNFFGPLNLDGSGKISGKFLSAMLNVSRGLVVKEIQIEWAPKDKKKYFDDNTSFDAYILCHDEDNKRIGVGIEVKYTEKSYPYGGTEKKRMNDKESPYHIVTRKCGIYRAECIHLLREKKFKQPWRNHLLGEKMVLNGDIDEFVSVLLFPQGNNYQAEVAKGYAELLKSEHAKRFVPITFEQFIEIGRTICGKHPLHMAWLEYLERRYNVS